MTQQAPQPDCPLCHGHDIKPFFADKIRRYLRCGNCQLVFVPPKFWLSPEAEKAEYDRHQNDPADTGYRAFLARLTVPLLQHLPAAQKGLDFGCGPGPALATMLMEQGHQVALFDPYYQNDPAVLKDKYDFICTTEVVEHLRRPEEEFSRLFSMLKPGGWLGIMTKLVRDQQAFSTWHYIRDLTHICFYSQATFTFLAQRFAAELQLIGNDVILFRKPESEMEIAPQLPSERA